MTIPAGHTFYYRFNAGKVPVTVEGKYLDDGKVASQIFPSQSVGDKWVDGFQAARATPGTVEFRFQAGPSASIAFEVTALPGPSQGPATNHASTVKQ